MIGAIAGDIIGSVYERHPIKSTDFPLFQPGCRFTDDTVLTVAVAESILTGADLAEKFIEYYRRYPHAGYGGTFRKWAQSKDHRPYSSWGNGSAMRVSPVGFAYNRLDEVLDRARDTAAITHNHDEGIKGAQATAAAVFLARTGKGKSDIRDYVESRFGYDLSAPLAEIRRSYTFDVSCQGSVPQSMVAFLESTDYETAVRNAISLGGDADTMACIAGAIAQAFYGGVPKPIRDEALARLDQHLRDVTSRFCDRFRCC